VDFRVALHTAARASYIEVLTNETNAFNAELVLTQAQLNELESLVEIYGNLGGGLGILRTVWHLPSVDAVEEEPTNGRQGDKNDNFREMFSTTHNNVQSSLHGLIGL
jgi:hypothetical protein